MKAKVHVVVYGKIKIFDCVIASPNKEDVEPVVDLFEGQYGFVYAVVGDNDASLYRSSMSPWEAGVVL